MIELLLETKLDTHQLRMAHVINESGLILLKLINENLDFSTIEAGKLTLENRTFNLRHKIEELIELMAERAQAKNLEFNFKLQPNLPVEVQGDPLRLYQILFNFLGNATKYTEAGEIFLAVRVFAEDEDKVTLHFAVRDTGLGILPEYHEKVFQPFYRVDSPESRKHEGSGLGLAIAKELVEMMQGEVGMESELGKGSTFWFTAVLEKQPGARDEEVIVPEDIRGARVLVVDDHPTNRLVLRELLRSWDCRCEEAADGPQAELLTRPQRLAPDDLAAQLRLAHAAWHRWTPTTAPSLLLGAGGSSIAISAYLMQESHGANRPSRIVVTNRRQPRLDEIRHIHQQSSG